MGASKKRKYIEVDSFKNMPVIELADLQAFVELVDQYKPEHLFTKKEAATNGEVKEAKSGDFLSRTRGLINQVSGAGKSEFYFVNENTVYSVSGNGYKTIEDYEEGMKKSYKSGDEYYASLNAGFENNDEYQQSVADGFSSKEEYDKAKNTGFIGGVAKVNAAKLAGEVKDNYFGKVKSIKKDGDLYRFARSAGFDSFVEFKDALKAGYVGANAEEYRAAKDSGFGDAEAYKSAKDGNFEDPEEYNNASQFGISNKAVFDRYKELENMKADKGYGFMDQANIFDLLNNLESGKLISFGKMVERLKESQALVKIKAPSNTRDWLNVKITKLMKVNSLPEWYTTSFKTNEEIKAFVINDEHIQKLGEYDQNSDVFIKN